MSHVPTLSEHQARELAAPYVASKMRSIRGARLGPVRELRLGWFFPFHADERFAGSNGVIVNKETGHALVLGSAFSPERDSRFYDLGYQSEVYDLTITAVLDPRRTLDTLLALRLQIVEESFEHGTHWKIPRALTRAELAERLRTVPCRFSGVKLYFHLEALEEARAGRWFEVTLAAAADPGSRAP